MERSVQFTLTCRKSLSKLCLCVNYPLVKKKKILMMLRSLLAGTELDANQYCRCGSVKCDSTCSVKFLFTYVCRRKSLASRLIKNNYIYGLIALPFMKLVHRPQWEWNNFIRVLNRVKLYWRWVVGFTHLRERYVFVQKLVHWTNSTTFLLLFWSIWLFCWWLVHG